jgi:hypothetical protein
MDLFWRWTREGRETIRKEKDERRTARLAESARHKELLSKAAGISSVLMVCHPDTWRFIEQNTPNESVFSHWSATPKPGEDGLVRVALSGPNLVTLLTRMRAKLNGWHPDDVEALAERIYAGTSQVIVGVDPDATDGAPIPDIVIDDKIGPSSSS